MVTSFTNFMSLLDVKQVNNVRNHKSGILDFVLRVKDCSVSRSEDILMALNEYHPPLTIMFSVVIRVSSAGHRRNSKLSYNFRRADLRILYHQLSLVDWSFLSNHYDINSACEEFYEVIYEIFDSCVPKTIPRSPKYPPWFTSDIRRICRLKSQSYVKYRQSGTDDDYNTFKSYRSRLKRLIKSEYEHYLTDCENSVASDPKRLWSFINSKKRGNLLPKVMEYNDISVSNSLDIASSFAEYFQSTYSTQGGEMALQASDKDTVSSLEISAFSLSEVQEALSSFRPKMTAGPDKIPEFILRDCATVLAGPLHILFNLCLDTSGIPDLWRVSKSVPVFKSGRKDIIVNYRQITLSCNFCKAFEQLLHKYLSNYAKHLISSSQHGFVLGRSVSTNLLCVTQFVAEALDDRSQVDVIYLDLTKAFDRIDHCLLLSKLDCIGLAPPLLRLLENYLQNRKQYVEIGGERSHDILVTSGVPQGSVLGPLLFNIFINDLFDNLSVRCLLYADDIKIYAKIQSYEDCLELQRALESVSHWCDQNGLSLSLSKCCCLSFTLKSSPLLFDYGIDGVSITRSDNVRDLGVTFDTKLSFTLHYESIIASAYKSMGFIMRNCREFHNVDTLKLLFSTFVRSRLEYASIVWCPGYTTHVTALEKVQRRYLKYLHLKQYGSYPPVGFPSLQLYSTFSLPSLESRREQSALKFLSNLISGSCDCPELLGRLNFTVPRLTTRYNSTFTLPTPRTNVLKFSPMHLICSTANKYESSVDIFVVNSQKLRRFALDISWYPNNI